jgi:hypothetical protein
MLFSLILLHSNPEEGSSILLGKSIIKHKTCVFCSEVCGEVDASGS